MAVEKKGRIVGGGASADCQSEGASPLRVGSSEPNRRSDFVLFSSQRPRGASFTSLHCTVNLTIHRMFVTLRLRERAGKPLPEAQTCRHKHSIYPLTIAHTVSLLQLMVYQKALASKLPMIR